MTYSATLTIGNSGTEYGYLDGSYGSVSVPGGAPAIYALVWDVSSSPPASFYFAPDANSPLAMSFEGDNYYAFYSLDTASYSDYYASWLNNAPYSTTVGATVDFTYWESSPAACSVVDTGSSTSSTIAIPSGVQVGDAIILFDYAIGSSPALVTPAGFKAIGTDSSASAALVLSVRIAESGDAGATVTGMNGSTSNKKSIAVVRGSSGPYYNFQATWDDASGAISLGGTIASPPVVAPVLSIGFAGSTGTATTSGTVVSGGTAFVNTTSFKAYWRFDSDARGSSLTFNLADGGTRNGAALVRVVSGSDPDGAIGDAGGELTATAVGAATVRRVGASASALTGLGIGAALVRAVGSASGSLAVNGVGVAGTPSDGAGVASATLTAAAVGSSTAQAVGAASATLTASGVGTETPITSAVGVAAGALTALATGRAAAESVGASTATLTTSGIGEGSSPPSPDSSIVIIGDPWTVVGGGGDPRYQKWSQWRDEEAARLRKERAKRREDRQMAAVISRMLGADEPEIETFGVDALVETAAAPRRYIDAAEIVASVIDGTEAAYAERRRKQESDVVQLLAMVM